MAKKYHVTPSGEVKECSAQKGGCPYGNQPHFDSYEEGVSYLDTKHEEEFGLLGKKDKITHEKNPKDEEVYREIDEADDWQEKLASMTDEEVDRQYREKLFTIAKEHLTSLETLETRKSDRLDFLEVSVWGLKGALEDTYKTGFEQAGGNFEKAHKENNEYIDGLLTTIAVVHNSAVETLEGKRNDELDFPEVAVWNLYSTLEEVHICGLADAATYKREEN